MKRSFRYSLTFGALAILMAAGNFAGAEDKAGAAADSPEARANAAKEKASCQNNLKQLGLVIKMYAGEHKELWPPLDPRPGYLCFVPNAVFPDYLTDANIMFCPTAKGAMKELSKTPASPANIGKYFDASSYWYTGYALSNEEDALAFVDAYKKLVKEGKPLPKQIPLADGKKVYAFKDGVERFLISDVNNPSASAQIRSSIPVLIDRPGSHPGGANVLYMDGHVEFVPYPGKFPMTEKFIKALESVDALRSAATK